MPKENQEKLEKAINNLAESLKKLNILIERIISEDYIEQKVREALEENYEENDDEDDYDSFGL